MAYFDSLLGKLAVGPNLSGYQPLDADLTAIAALGFTTAAFLKKTAADTWALDTSTYLTAEADTLDTVLGRGATSDVAMTLTAAAPQLTLGSTINLAGLKLVDAVHASHFAATLTTPPTVGYATGNFNVIIPDFAADTNLIGGTPASTQVPFGATTTGALLFSKNLRFTATTPALEIGSITGVANPSLIFNQLVVTNKAVTLRASAVTTANVTYSLPAAAPATATQLMTMTTAGAMGTFGIAGSTGMYLRGVALGVPVWSTLVLPNAATANRVVFASSTNVYGEDADFTFLTDTLTITKIVIGSITTIGATAPVADGTYNTGLGPLGGMGTITTKSGIITAVVQAT